MKVRLVSLHRDFSGTPYPEGTVVETFEHDGGLFVLGAQHLKLNSQALTWTPILEDRDIEKILNGDEDDG